MPTFWDNLASWTNDVRSVATGEKSPTFNLALEKSTTINIVVGVFAALTAALVIKECIAFFFRSLQKP